MKASDYPILCVMALTVSGITITFATGIIVYIVATIGAMI